MNEIPIWVKAGLGMAAVSGIVGTLGCQDRCQTASKRSMQQIKS